MVKTNVEIHFVTTLVVIRTQRPVDFSSNFPLFSTRTLRRKYEYKVVVGLEKTDEKAQENFFVISFKVDGVSLLGYSLEGSSHYVIEISNQA